ncbi:hypothetical protein C8F01DRAFT_1234102 [Mycena amicta]|nr:hypothetical protein C8F01DRAFT_1234102 [Mycena amicta]
MTSTASELRQKLSALDDKIETLRSRLSGLTDSRRKVVAKLRKITYPAILSLPREITAEIFVHSVDSVQIQGLVEHSSPKFRPHELMPLVLASFYYTRADSHREFIGLCLERARTHPLQISIHAGEITKSFLLTLLGGEWVQFTTSLDDLVEHREAFEALRGRLSTLRTLKLGNNELPTHESISDVVTVFAEAPQLRELDLSSIRASYIDLPWHQLTTVTCRGLDVFRLYELLRLIPNVEHLTVYVCGELIDDVDDGDLPTDLSLPRLHTLHVTYNDYAEWIWADYLTVPALTHLHVHWLNRESTNSIVHLLARSKCHLSSLSLSNVSSEHIRAIFHHTSSLTELSILAFPGAPAEIMALIMLPWVNLSKLRRLHIQRHGVELPYAQLARFLAERSIPPDQQTAGDRDGFPSDLRQITVKIGSEREELVGGTWDPFGWATERGEINAIRKLTALAASEDNNTCKFSLVGPWSFNVYSQPLRFAKPTILFFAHSCGHANARDDATSYTVAQIRRPISLGFYLHRIWGMERKAGYVRDWR